MTTSSPALTSTVAIVKRLGSEVSLLTKAASFISPGIVFNFRWLPKLLKVIMLLLLIVVVETWSLLRHTILSKDMTSLIH